MTSNAVGIEMLVQGVCRSEIERFVSFFYLRPVQHDPIEIIVL